MPAIYISRTHIATKKPQSILFLPPSPVGSSDEWASDENVNIFMNVVMTVLIFDK